MLHGVYFSKSLGTIMLCSCTPFPSPRYHHQYFRCICQYWHSHCDIMFMNHIFLLFIMWLFFVISNSCCNFCNLISAHWRKWNETAQKMCTVKVSYLLICCSKSPFSQTHSIKSRLLTRPVPVNVIIQRRKFLICFGNEHSMIWQFSFSRKLFMPVSVDAHFKVLTVIAQVDDGYTAANAPWGHDCFSVCSIAPCDSVHYFMTKFKRSVLGWHTSHM